MNPEGELIGQGFGIGHPDRISGGHVLIIQVIIAPLRVGIHPGKEKLTVVDREQAEPESAVFPVGGIEGEAAGKMVDVGDPLVLAEGEIQQCIAPCEVGGIVEDRHRSARDSSEGVSHGRGARFRGDAQELEAGLGQLRLRGIRAALHTEKRQHRCQ